MYFCSKTDEIHYISNLFYYFFTVALYVFRTVSPSIIRSLRLYIQHQVYVIQVLWLAQLLCNLIQTSTPNGHLYRVTYTICRIDTINSPDDGHMAVRNM